MSVYTCPICRNDFRRAAPAVSCTVAHAPGECCHYGDEMLKRDR